MGENTDDKSHPMSTVNEELKNVSYALALRLCGL